MAVQTSVSPCHSSSAVRPLGLTQAGLRLHHDRFALKSSFFNGATSVQLFVAAVILRLASSPPRFTMRVASRQAYICRDCGYIYSDRKPFEKLPDNYFCPVCGAPKRSFKPHQPAVTKDANDTDVRKVRKADMKRDEAIGNALSIAIVVGVAALAGLYFYLSNA